eukprot:6492734-Amphidinium_carterae.1
MLSVLNGIRAKQPKGGVLENVMGFLDPIDVDAKSPYHFLQQQLKNSNYSVNHVLADLSDFITLATEDIHGEREVDKFLLMRSTCFSSLMSNSASLQLTRLPRKALGGGLATWQPCATHRCLHSQIKVGSRLGEVPNNIAKRCLSQFDKEKSSQHGGQAVCDEAVAIFHTVMERIKREHDPLPHEDLLLAETDRKVQQLIVHESQKVFPGIALVFHSRSIAEVKTVSQSSRRFSILLFEQGGRTLPTLFNSEGKMIAANHELKLYLPERPFDEHAYLPHFLVNSGYPLHPNFVFC